MLRKFLFFPALVLSFTVYCCFASTADTPAPNFTIEHEGLPDSLANLQGQVVYLDFWASWCKPCRKSFPWMNAMGAKYGPEGLQILAINLDAVPQLARQFLDKVPATMPIIYDPAGNIAAAYQLLGMPSSYLIDKKGLIRIAHKGFFINKQAEYEQEIQTLLSEVE
ncbi:MAG: thiol-disulfide isomerase/thioredoxin [Paraglaciecola sp.]|jgi:thiol-disulfide isomerase/thioredoxin